MKDIGYDRQLYIQPFDHRGSFKKGFFGIKGEVDIAVGHDQFNPIADAKTLVYRGLLRAIELGVPKEFVGILIDTQFGSHIIADAKSKDISASICVEKSGQPVFDFEYGSAWQDHLRFMRPDIVKVLVRHHPGVDDLGRREQMVRLRELSDFVHSGNDFYFMFELLVPASTDEEKAMGAKYDTDVRPGLMIEAIQELQEFGVEPDIWKIEGLDSADDARAVAAQTRTGGRDAVGNILLGRGSDEASVHKWLRTAAPIDGYIGFAVGRTNFKVPLETYLEAPSEESAQTAVEQIAQNYKGCVDVWQDARS